MTAAVRSVRDFRGVVDGDFPVVLANSVLSYLFAVVGELDDRVTVFFNELPEEYISSVRFFANIRSVTVPAIVALWIVGVVQRLNTKTAGTIAIKLVPPMPPASKLLVPANIILIACLRSRLFVCVGECVGRLKS